MSNYEVRLIHTIDDADDDNIDVQVTLADGTFCVPTFITVKNIQRLMAKWRTTGECANGLYLWIADMIVVERLTEDVVRDSIAGLIRDGELDSACKMYPPRKDDPDDLT